MTRVARIRERYKDEVQTRHGFPLTYLRCITRAAAEALRAFPILNASVDGSNIDRMVVAKRTAASWLGVMGPMGP